MFLPGSPLNKEIDELTQIKVESIVSNKLQTSTCMGKVKRIKEDARYYYILSS